MPEIVITLNFSLDYTGQETQAMTDKLLREIKAGISSRGGTVGAIKKRIYSHQLMALGIREKDTLRFTAAGVITREDLLDASEKDLCTKKGIDYALMFRVRRILHERGLYLKGDSRQNYLDEIIAYLKDYNGQTYRRLRQKGIRTLEQLQQAFLARTSDTDVITTMAFISGDNRRP